MPSPLDPSVIRSAFQTFDTLADDVVRLSKAESPGLFQRAQARELEALATSVQAQVSDAATAAESLQLGSSATQASALRQSIAGVDVLDLKPVEQIRTATTIQPSLVEARSTLSLEIGNLVDDELRSLLKTPPRDLDSTQVERIRTLLDARSAAQVDAPGVAGSISTDALSSGPAELVTALQNAHMQVNGTTRTVASSRVKELLVGRSSALDATDAAEVRAILASDQVIAPTLPRELGVTGLDDLLARFVDGSTTEADRRTLDVFTGAISDDRGQAGSLARDLFARGAQHTSQADMGTISALLHRPGRSHFAVGAGGQYSGFQRLQALVDDAARGTIDPDLATELQVWRSHLDGAASSTDDLSGAIREVLESATDEIDHDGWARFRALDRIAGERKVRPTVGLPEDADQLAVLARESGTPSHEDRRFVEAWRQHLSGEQLDVAARDRQLLELLDTPGPLSADARARLHLLVDADAADKAPVLVQQLDGAAPARDLLAADDPGLLQYLEQWRVARDGTLADAARTDAAIEALLAQPAGDLQPRDWARMEALVDGARGRHGITLDGDDVAPVRELIRGLQHDADGVDPAVVRQLESWRVGLDGTATDVNARRGAILSLVERDPATLELADRARLRSLVAADAHATERVGIPHEIEGMESADEALTAFAAARSDAAVPHRYLESWNANLSGATDDADSLHAAITAQLERDPATFGPADWARLRAYVAADAETGLVGLEQTLDDGSSALQKLDQLTVGSSPLDSDTSQLLTSWQLRAGRVADDPDRLRSLVASQIRGDVADYSAHDWQRLRTLVGLDPTVDQTRLATSIDGIDDVDTILGAASNGGSFRQGDAERYVDLWRLQLEAPSAAAVAAQMDELGGRAADTLTTNDWRRARALLDLDATTDTGRFVRDIDGLVSAEDSLTSLVDGSRTVGGTARRYMSIWAAEARGVTRSSRQLTNELRSVLDGAEPESIDDWIRLRTLFEIDQQRSSPKLTGALTDSPVARELLEQLGDGTVQQIDDMRRYLKTWQYALDGTTASGDKTRAALNEVLARQTGELSPDELRRLRVLVDGDAARSELGLARRLDGATAATDLLAPKGDAEAAKAVPDLDRYTELWRSQLAGTADDETHLRGIVEPLLAKGIDQLDETELRALRGVLDADQASGRLGLLRQLDGTTPPVPQLTSRIATPDASLGSLERYARTWASQLDGSATDRDALARSLSTLVSDLHAGGLDDEGRRALQALVDIDAATGTLGLARSVGKLPAVDQLLASTSLDPNHMRRYADVWTAQVDGIASTRGRLAPRLDALLSRESADLTPEDWSTLRHLVDVDAAGGGVGLGRKLPFEKDAATLLDGTVDGKGVHATLERYLTVWRMQLDGSATDRDAMARRVIELVERNPDALAVDEVPKLRALLDADSLTHVLGLKRPNVNSDQLGSNFAKASQGTTTSELGRSLELWDLQARGILGDVAASRTELLRLVDRAPAEITARNWARAAALLDPDHGGRALGLSRELPGLASAQKLATLGSGGNAVDETTARSFASIWKYQVDGTLADPIAFKTELTRLLDVPSGERTADEWIKLIALVDADRQQLHVGLTQLPESTARTNIDKLIKPGSTSAQGMAGYEQIWRHELDGTFQDGAKLRELVASITSGSPSKAPREDWMVLNHALEMDARSGALGLTHLTGSGSDFAKHAHTLASGSGGDIAVGTRQLMFGQWRTDIGTGYALSESQALQNGRLAAHMIRRADVDGFLADSTIRQTVFHGSTNAETHAHIIEKGPLVDKNKRSAFGRGFYTATEPGGWGDDIVEVAIDTRRPLIVDNTDHLSSWVSSHGGGDKREAVLRNGYDSIVYRNGDGKGGDWLIGLKDDAIKIVVEDAPGTFDERGILPTKLDWGSLT